MIGIIAAMEEEIAAFLALMSDHQVQKIKGITFYQGRLAGRDVVLCQSGVGKVYAAISTTILIDSFPIDYIINIGSAGSLDASIDIGSVVIPDLIAHHDCDVVGWVKGFNEENKRMYRADARLLKIARLLADEKTYFLPLVSGDSFINLPEQTTKILKEYPQAACCEMEAASIAQTASFFDVPFIIIRGISDVTVKEGSETDFLTYLAVAAKNSAAFCQRYIEQEEKYNEVVSD